MTTGWVCDSFGSTVILIWSRIPFITWLPYVSNLAWGHEITAGPQVPKVNSNFIEYL